MVSKLSEYRRHAEECRTLARGLGEGSQRDQLIDMALAWEALANDLQRREERNRTQPEAGTAADSDWRRNGN